MLDFFFLILKFIAKYHLDIRCVCIITIIGAYISFMVTFNLFSLIGCVSFIIIYLLVDVLKELYNRLSPMLDKDNKRQCPLMGFIHRVFNVSCWQSLLNFLKGIFFYTKIETDYLFRIPLYVKLKKYFNKCDINEIVYILITIISVICILYLFFFC